VVYLAESPAGALLEVCAHTAANDVPSSYTLLEISVPANVTIEHLEKTALPKDWPENLAETRAIGSEWLRAGRSALLRVPSVIVPATYNVLLNPVHPKAKQAEIKSMLEYPFDVRLKGK
jgi:RES domain-containing protein